MAQRVQLQTLLESIQGSESVYFQPPSNITMEYPCIVYHVSDLDSKFADNLPYLQKVQYQITVIDRDSTAETWKKVGALPLCSMDRTAVVENLNHYYFTLYF